MPRSPFSSSTPTPTTLMTCTQPTPSTAASIGVRCDSALDDASPLAASVHAAGAPRAPPTVHDGDDGSARAHGAPSDADVARMKAKRRKALFDS
ncbi:hypothetical protein KFE25_002051 [Diacronema lutheri]|uniref:Uncharacterized protein n=2 Tax=Diacronema lutheri TaxID=2081491 RepID=A0A8J6CDW5_DIALT|nr:hypothetical protein KFE25_002051 [Diacronema lutheri]